MHVKTCKGNRANSQSVEIWKFCQSYTKVKRKKGDNHCFDNRKHAGVFDTQSVVLLMVIENGNFAQSDHFCLSAQIWVLIFKITFKCSFQGKSTPRVAFDQCFSRPDVTIELIFCKVWNFFSVLTKVLSLKRQITHCMEIFYQFKLREIVDFDQNLPETKRLLSE